MPDDKTLEDKVDELLDAVSKSKGGRPMISDPTTHDYEAEDLKKAWFRHVLSSVEKIGTLVENIRTGDLINLKADLKEEIRKVEARLDRLEQQVRENKDELLKKVEKVDSELIIKIEKSHQELLKRIKEVNNDLQAYKTTIESKLTQAENDLKIYKNDIVEPLKMKILTISVKLGVWATIAGLVGSGLFAVGFFLLKEYVLKP